MKVLFLCGSLEPGRDGVGDYTRRIANELIKRGHSVAAIAICDPYIKAGLLDTDCLEGGLRVVRLALNGRFSQRLIKFKTVLEEIDPDWISFQFVPFSFDARGVVFKFGQTISKILVDRRCQLMIHELWVGMDEAAPLKHRLWGWLQKQSIKWLIRRIKPNIITTQSRLYVDQLSELGFKSYYLPLFSNIPNTGNDQNRLLEANSNDELVFVIFGSIHPNIPVNDFANEALTFSVKNQKSICLKFVGRCGSQQNHWINIWKGTGLRVHVMGEQKSQLISSALNSATLGIATTPIALLDKSGAVAAMREHGLPVIAVTSKWHPKGFKVPNLPEGVTKFEKGDFQRVVSAVASSDFQSVEQVTRQFESLLLRVS